MANWKITVAPETRRSYTVPFLRSRKFFAVDDSGSTWGYGILKHEKAFVQYVHDTYKHSDDLISAWGTACDNPSPIFHPLLWDADHGGTEPQNILSNPAALDAIHQANVWFLITDGEIQDKDVTSLASYAHSHNVMSVPVVFLIVEQRGATPGGANISVGVTFYAEVQDAMILFKDTDDGQIHLIAAKGCFAPLAGTDDLTSWEKLPTFTGEQHFFKHCEGYDIKVPTVESREGPMKGISLGPQWDEANGGSTWVDLDVLLDSGSLTGPEIQNLLAEEAFHNLVVAYKLRNRLPELRTFLLVQKVEQINPRLEDVSGAAKIISKLSVEGLNESERLRLQEELRNAHANNREQYRRSLTNSANSPEIQEARMRNRLVDDALQALAAIEAAGYSADILSRRSNRARRANAVSDDSAVALEILDLDGPSYKASCFICCGENATMSVCLKEVDFDGANTTDFALNFPLAAAASESNMKVLSSQNICFQCSLISPSYSIWKEKIKAIIPFVNYEGANKRYIESQLYLALTESLSIGPSIVSQLFMGIIHGHLASKQWAGAGLSDSELDSAQYKEERQRRNALLWMLDELLQKTWTREDFMSTGKWVQFPQALSWLLEDFEKNNVSSRLVTYPVAGFDTLLSFGLKTAVFSAANARLMRISKLIYSVASKYLADLQSYAHFEKDWKQVYLKCIFQEFNSALVPKDLCGPQSLVTDVEDFYSRLSVLLEMGQSQNYTWMNPETKSTVMHKIQLLLFWLVYKERNPMKTQTYFQILQRDNQMASALLDPHLTVPISTLHEQLLSTFVSPDNNQFIDSEARRTHMDFIAPFKTPFGPSVLHCGMCNTPFLTLDSGSPLEDTHVRTILKNRKDHLIHVFGIRGSFEQSTNGMPEPTSFGRSPTSAHANYHSNLVQAWVEASQNERRAIVHDESARDQFVRAVQTRICEQGRGDVYNQHMERHVRDMLPSFFNVLAQALRMQEKDDGDLSVYVHDFEENSLEDKARFELRLRAEKREWRSHMLRSLGTLA
ncbi:hypothetical protein M011DRAFT_150509 [Sporormia fimetaria CBS 119925]|uniref:Uncharacterized protein n=1 Tax=Sporormia fimetaria CBS 119925 TaxID=1340428 RepID=A0A6A6V621_9PLEO|nr:hypothetical protein M011DRAFT_150509 [Sporormia fimetaria CBS 119925]